MSTRYITNEQHYSEVTARIAAARRFVWLGTADIKDMHVKDGSRTVSFLAVLERLVKKKVAVRLLHAKEPGPNFRRSFDRYRALWSGMERQLCPRVHFKIVVVDGLWAYTGSANLTGAGLGMKSKDNRNFEAGIITTNPEFIELIMNRFDEVWMGSFCKKCGRRDFCGDPIL